MDVTIEFLNILSKIVAFLKYTNFTMFDVNLSLWDVLIGGTVLFLVLYFIFRVGD